MKYRLRPWVETDINSLSHYANNINVAKFLTDAFPHPYSSEDAKHFINRVSTSNPINVFAIEVNKEASGSIGLYKKDDIYCKNAELGYWLAEHLWGNEIMVGCIKEIVEYGFSTYDIIRIFARPFGNNIASQRVLEKAGFILEAKFSSTLFKNGEFQDEMVYAIRKKGQLIIKYYSFI